MSIKNRLSKLFGEAGGVEPSEVEKVPCRKCGSMILPETASDNEGLCMPCFKNPDRGKPSQIILAARQSPPRFLDRFNANRRTARASEIEPFEGSVAFQILCKCGSDTLRVYGYEAMSQAFPDMPVFLAPLSIECVACNKSDRLFDPRRDGYDGEDHSSAGATGSGKPTAFCCSECQHSEFQIATLLEYSLDDEEMEDWPELSARPQDFFTWFTLYGWCARCGSQAAITDYECA